MIYFPKEVWRTIFEYDRTYKEIYNRVMMELELRWFIVKYLELETEIVGYFNHDDYDFDIDWGI